MMKISKRQPTLKTAHKITRNEIPGQRIIDLTADLQRVQADFVNYKRRTEEDGIKQRQYGKQLAVAQLLAVADSLEKALHSTPKDLFKHPWVEGIRSIQKQLRSELQKLGVAKIDTLRQEFDPQYMDAVSVEGESGGQEIVSEVIQEGYRMGEDVIRHAIVKVRRK